MSKRKPHNMRARLERTSRALVSANHAAVVNIDPSGQQVLINRSNLKQICIRQIVDAVCDIPHSWTIYLSVLCRNEFGERYHKSIEVVPQGSYRAEHLTDVIEATYTDLRSTANPNHLVASGWIAIPTDTTLDEAEAAKIFAMVGAWNQQKAA
ncbi:hypothetical protein [Pseudomonas cremoricolorata]|uniref:Uncharacterized protein n=1 Tax=Pseudomonas cremoricolorata TaxID=157783 RepID=A0A089WTP4_9PSED|nr:hypothetical protein [Pseudomonas cremoricolorata]AIR90554.1 hypothetical protein LK03_15250 [Pseudomonas cremoricolorata]